MGTMTASDRTKRGHRRRHAGTATRGADHAAEGEQERGQRAIDRPFQHAERAGKTDEARVMQRAGDDQRQQRNGAERRSEPGNRRSPSVRHTSVTGRRYTSPL